MNRPPLVSIIIPCYNYGHLLGDTLDSVLNQTYQNWECIIVDDGSIDNSKEIAVKYCSIDTRIKYLYQPNKGLATARNTGLRDSQGEFIQFLDADDILASDKIAKHINVFLSHTSLDVVFCAAYNFIKGIENLPEATKVELKAKPITGHGKEVLDELIIDNMFLVHCALFRASLITEVGYFNETMITCEDWNFWFRIALANKKFMYSSEEGAEVYVRSHGKNMSGVRRNMWVGKISFYQQAIVLLSDRNAKEFRALHAKAFVLFCTYSMRYEYAYGSPLKGILGTIRTVYFSGSLFSVLYDSLYWVKERMLKRL